jgi:hypothetical protein
VTPGQATVDQRGHTVVVSNLSPALPDEALSMLADGEVALAFAWARVQKFGTLYSTFYPFGLVVEGVDLVRNRVHMTKLREVTLDLGLPLDRNMAMVVTPNRLLIWKAHRRPRRVGEFLGEVSQARIAAAKMPFSNSGPWRTVRLWLTDTTPFQFQIDAKTSEAFVSALDKIGNN